METAVELKEVVLDLHGLLRDMDPARRAQVSVESLRQRYREASQHLDRRLTALPPNPPSDERAALERLRSALVGRQLKSPADIVQTRNAALPHYEALAAALRRRGVRVDSLNPHNGVRTLFHVLSGVGVVAACHLVLTPRTGVMVAAVFAAFCWSLEIARRVKPEWNDTIFGMFRAVAREHERYRPNSSTWYATALLLISLTAFNAAGMLGIMALAVGDPAAAVVGRRFGRIKLMRGRTLEGSLAFVLVSLLGGIAYLLVIGTPVGLPLLLLPLAAGVAGAVAEAISTRVDDNFSVPLAGAYAALLVQALVG
ncbi:MAG: diacylglycerol/polyprenol kinase family protein [Myxococcota bacterium]